MHFTTLFAASAAVTGALAGVSYEYSYTTVDDKVYTSVSTCTGDYEPTEAPVYEPTSSVYAVPTEAPVYEVTYTSYAHVTVTSCADYVTNCPAVVYTSTAYSVSTCTGGSSYPTDVPEYETPSNGTYAPPPPVYESYAPEPTYAPSDTYTQTYYTTVCPGKDYCYGTTITSTYCPYATPTEVPTTSTYCPPTETATYVPVAPPTYVPVPPPTYTTHEVPSYNASTPTYSPPPSYTGAASANAVSFGVAAIAGLAALFIAA
jgi:hypothetical protein